MASTATIMRPNELELPFWNSSQTNLPRPGFCASISAAISTIQPVASDRRKSGENHRVWPRGYTIFLYVNQTATAPSRG